MRHFRLAPFAIVLAQLGATAVAQQNTEPPGAVPVAAPVVAVQPLAAERQPGFASIDPELCRKWLTYLASDELRGRATGTEGYELAAKFVAARFAEFGLKPIGDDGTYFQSVPFHEVGANLKASYLAVIAEDGTELLRVAVGEGLGGSITEASERELPLVALIATSAEDVAKADLAGKAVLFVDRSEGERGSPARQALRRADPGPGVILTIDDDSSARTERRIVFGGERNRARSGRQRRPNTYAVSSAIADRIQAAIESRQGAVKLVTHIELEQEPVFAANVVGLLEGSDPELRAEIVGIGSHLDHIGARGDQINNGADDDGSGTTGVLAVARAFAQNPHKPRRSILFMCFAGEEMGLIGSRHYTENPIFPNANMVAELQMDMIGRNEERVDTRTGEELERPEDNLNTLHLVGTEKLSKELHEICLATNEAHVGFTFEYDEENVFSRSDHASFARKDIPIAFFFTGFHPQYHHPDDSVDRIDFPKLARVAQLVYAIAFEVADREQRIVRDRLWSEIPQEGR